MTWELPKAPQNATSSEETENLCSRVNILWSLLHGQIWKASLLTIIMMMMIPNIFLIARHYSRYFHMLIHLTLPTVLWDRYVFIDFRDEEIEAQGSSMTWPRSPPGKWWHQEWNPAHLTLGFMVKTTSHRQEGGVKQGFAFWRRHCILPPLLTSTVFIQHLTFINSMSTVCLEVVFGIIPNGSLEKTPKFTGLLHTAQILFIQKPKHVCYFFKNSFKKE